MKVTEHRYLLRDEYRTYHKALSCLLTCFTHSLTYIDVVLGMKQSGAPLGDVVLPPWAKGDAREFIRAHREVGRLVTCLCTKALSAECRQCRPLSSLVCRQSLTV